MYVIDLVEKIGFSWENAPRVLYTDRRDEILLRGLTNVLGGRDLRRRDVSPVLAGVFNELASRFAGREENELVIDWLVRLRAEVIASPEQAPRLALAAEVTFPVW